MLSPSTAPRWKMATRIFLRRPVPSAANTDRPSQEGAAPTPKIASAEPFRNPRRVAIFIYFLAGQGWSLILLTFFENRGSRLLIPRLAQGFALSSPGAPFQSLAGFVWKFRETTVPSPS